MSKWIEIERASRKTTGLIMGVDKEGNEPPIGVVVDSSAPGKLGMLCYRFSFESASDTVICDF